MNSMVIYASRYGNTHKIAETIAAELGTRGPAHLLAADEAPNAFPTGTDLVVIGCPTEGHRMIDPIIRYFDRLGPDAFQGVAGAAFDTRLSWPAWLSGSAAAGITKKLRSAGARIVLPEASFIVVGGTPSLAPGELERAVAWAASLAGRMETKTAVGAGAISSS